MGRAPTRDLLIDANWAVRTPRRVNERAIDIALLKRLEAGFWDPLREVLAFDRKLPRLPGAPRGKPRRGPGENLLCRLHQFKDNALRLLVDFEAPFTNNLTAPPMMASSLLLVFILRQACALIVEATRS